MVSIYNSSIRIAVCCQLIAQTCSIKNIISQYKGYTILSDKICTDYKCLGEAIGYRLFCISYIQTVLGTIAK